MRFERKYRIVGKSLAVVNQLMRLHPAGFRPLYPDRQVNNIYFDTPEFTTYHQNVYGINQRRKYRVRWYGDTPFEIQKPRFEIKIKHNELGDKVVHPIDDFSLDSLKPLSRAVIQWVPEMHTLQPVLLNSYTRSYFISQNKQFRLTVDHTLCYHSLWSIPHFRRYQIRDEAIILEIKYDEGIDDLVPFITQHMPFRQSRHSKYVNGIYLTQ